MGVNRWCMQCATNPAGRREVPAVGVDEDGEPACFHHLGKSSSLARAQAEMRERNQAPKPAPSLRVCEVEGCEVPLAAHNRSGRCKAHWYARKATRDALKAIEAAHPAVITKLARPAEVVIVNPFREPPATEPAQQPAPAAAVAKAELLALRAKLAGQIEAIDRVMEMLG